MQNKLLKTYSKTAKKNKNSKKQPYLKPKLSSFGSISTLTFGSGGSSCDANGARVDQLGGGNDQNC